jgi:hypothetical protein
MNNLIKSKSNQIMKLNFQSNLMLRDEVEKKSIKKRTKKNLVQLGLTRKTHDSDYEIEIIL